MNIATRRSLGVGEITTLFAVSTLGLFLRAPDALLNPQFIAEDGVVFFANQLGHSLPPLFGPVQGYWVFLDRLIAWFASAFPLVLIPFVYNLSATLLAAASITYFCCRARDVFHPVASLAVLLLVPMISGIMLDNITHLQWFSQLALASASLLPRPLAARNSGIARIVEMAFLAIVAFTGPFAILCSLVYLFLQTVHMAAALARLTRIRESLREYLRSLDIPALVVTLVAGAILLTLAGGQNKIPLFPLHKIPEGFFLVVLGIGLQVHTMGPVLFPQIAFAWFQVALFGIVVLAPMSARARTGCLALLLYGWLVLLAGCAKALALGGTAPNFNYDDKYFFALAIIEWLVLWRIVSSLLRGTPTVPTLMTVSAMGSVAIAYPYWHTRPALPDTNWAQYAKRIEVGETLDVPIYPPPWFFHVAGQGKQLTIALQPADAVHQDAAHPVLQPGSQLYREFNIAHAQATALRIIIEDGKESAALHAPDSIPFRPAPGNYVASGTFGIQSAALKDLECLRNDPDGIGASVLLNHAGKEKVLWHGETDPFHFSADRGPQHFRVESIDIGEDDELIYRVDSGHGGHNVSCDWTYVRDFVLRRRGDVGSFRAGPGAIFQDGFD